MRRLLIGIGVLVVVAVGALVIFSLAGGNGEDDPAETTLPPVETGDLVEADAVVVPVRSADLSLPSAGTVAELLVAVGEQVDAGQVLVRLDAEQEAAALAEAGAALASARAGLAQLTAAQAKEEADEADARPVELAAARTAVLDARQVLKDAQDIAQITQETQDRASASQRALDNAGRDVIVARLDGNAEIEAAQKSYDESEEDYSDVYSKWLGLTPSEEESSQDPDALFEAWDLDLETVFDRANLPSTGLAVANDPSTVWNELIVYIWAGDNALKRTCGAGISASMRSHSRSRSSRDRATTPSSTWRGAWRTWRGPGCACCTAAASTTTRPAHCVPRGWAPGSASRSLGDRAQPCATPCAMARSGA